MTADQTHNVAHDLTRFSGVERVVAEPLRFKAKLAIGEDAYASLRMVNRAREVWDVLGAAGAGAAIAKSSLVASTFFAPSGLMGAMGIGAAATPVGWVAFAALASGGACYGIYRWLGHSKGSRVIEIPKFLNTPLDTLGLALFDLIAPLSLSLAMVDGEIEAAERAFLRQHLVDEWGLDPRFIDAAIGAVESELAEAPLEVLAKDLSDLLHANPDCNQKVMVEELIAFLAQMLEAAGPLSNEESLALARVSQTLRAAPASELAASWATAKTKAGEAAEQVKRATLEAADWTAERLPTAEQLREAAEQSTQRLKVGASKAGQTAEQLGLAAAEAAAQATAWASERLPSQEQLLSQAQQTGDQLKLGLARLKAKLKS
ncbi:TerB family tellurite resistance protein [Paucibacter sp. DJ2R-2]|uniref:TerB family tellurite resistance protein n=1 Tax=Paucibacter sp. DJ2R-2 TaxID=2893558 RepID=UPI0021E4E7CE|nr:TerB family tellurite resistance protein [Paucibacter sp. DJ2R-2]MCV2422044.1 TerB family tellurite resistance protein [Paucibacter sp. DJ4R-1]MCV2439339.1 TerB family tellurite resistance protein [Paucibacter sp. DJ2R-2]